MSMENQPQLCVGIVGCGYQGGILARSICAGKLFRITACADPDLTAAGRIAALAGGASTFASVDAMLAAAEVDAVFVATPHHVLYESSLAAIQAGKHVLTEKPIGTDEKEAAQLEEAVARTGVCFMTGYSFRFIAALQKAKELVQAGTVGEVHTISGSIGVGPMSSGWRAGPETGGGPLLYVGTHLVDAMLWYMQDEPVQVYADIRFRADTRADETTTFHVQFAQGAVAQGMVTQTATGLSSHLDIFGRQGRISLRGIGFAYEIDVESRVIPAYAQPTTLRIPQRDDLRIAMHTPQLAEFAAAIHEARQPSVTVTDGRRVLRVLDGITKSDRRGEPIRIG